MTFETLVTIIFVAIILACYIYLKASGEWWYGIQWGRIFYEIRRGVCILLLKIRALFN